MKKITIVILLVLTLASTNCGKKNLDSWVLENRLNEAVKTEVFTVPFNYPVQPLQKAEYTLKANERVELLQITLQKAESFSVHEALFVFYGIPVDSMIITFENGKMLNYSVKGDPDSLNPLHTGFNTTGWKRVSDGEDLLPNTFFITEEHKNKAQ
jgi:hypothetical protein